MPTVTYQQKSVVVDGEKRKEIGESANDDESQPPRKRCRKIYCSVDECTKWARQGGVCIRHGAKAKMKRCRIDGCTTYAKEGGVCQRHGAKVKVKLCSVEECTNQTRSGGLCRRHGAKSNITPSTNASGSRSGSRGNADDVQQQQPQYIGSTSGLSSLDQHPYLQQWNDNNAAVREA